MSFIDRSEEHISHLSTLVEDEDRPLLEKCIRNPVKKLSPSEAKDIIVDWLLKTASDDEIDELEDLLLDRSV